jgi:subtilisin family serine protease
MARLARLRVEPLEQRCVLSATLSWTPNDPHFPLQHGLHNIGQSGATPDIDINAPETWRVATIARTTVGVIDTGIDYTHPDLALNIWINQAEIPPHIRANLVDIDGDGRITFRDLNNPRNQGPGKITDLNGNGIIDAGDILRPISQGGWATGTDTARNGYIDDLVGWNFVNNTNNPFDDHGHGSHIAGTIGAVGNNGIGVAGIAWNTQLMALKTFDSRGASDTRWLSQALDYATANGARVVNASWVLGSESAVLNAAIDRAAARNVVVVASAGNNARNIDITPIYPASGNRPNVVTVTAVDPHGRLSSYANFGVNSVDIAAPGNNIYSTNSWGNYGNRSGTSMATSFVTGAVALVTGLRPEWNYRSVIDQILTNVKELSALQGRVGSAGMLDLSKAIRVPPRPQLPPPFKPRLAELPPALAEVAPALSSVQTLVITPPAPVMSQVSTQTAPPLAAPLDAWFSQRKPRRLTWGPLGSELSPPGE